VTSDQRVPRPDVGGSGVAIAEVGQLAGVSIATGSQALNNIPGQVSPARRCRVLRVIHDLDYRPNVLARSLQPRRAHTIGLILLDIATTCYAEIARDIEAVAPKSGSPSYVERPCPSACWGH
jgi:LacI family transcriptional regulator